MYELLQPFSKEQFLDLIRFASQIGSSIYSAVVEWYIMAAGYQSLEPSINCPAPKPPQKHHRKVCVCWNQRSSMCELLRTVTRSSITPSTSPELWRERLGKRPALTFLTHRQTHRFGHHNQDGAPSDPTPQDLETKTPPHLPRHPRMGSSPGRRNAVSRFCVITVARRSPVARRILPWFLL
ncbi:hypothetical protein Bca52824_059808 [Brassica carinata]|uniref:Uncharacterized protein n=1 Tax=Brassica carinata TaxID=52824 RepID=A0A8X7QV21_BRACI|nr:hypothetical protein Bca52824_059808 [Brassica carinata]